MDLLPHPGSFYYPIHRYFWHPLVFYGLYPGIYYNLLFNKMAYSKNLTPLSKNDIADFAIWAAFGIIIGGRLGYATFYAPEIFIEFDSYFPYWELLKIHHGGLASHGGIVGLIIATILFAKRRGFSTYHCLDLTAFGSLGVFFGRIANFINGELFGRVVEGKTLLAVQFPQEMFLWVSQRKTEHLKDLSTVVTKIKTGLNSDIWQDWIYQFGSNGSYKAQIYSTIHSLIEACQKGNKEVISSLKEILSYRHPSQIYQSLLEGLLPFLLVLFLWKKKSLKPGMLGGILALCYGLMRILGEQFRMPDAHLGFRALGLTRGQWLSIVMLLCILIYFVLIFKNQKIKKQ